MSHKETANTLGVEEATQLEPNEIAVGELRKRRVEEQTTISLDGLVNAVKPSPPATSTNGELQITGPVWWISLNSDQAKDLATALATLGPAAAAIIPPPGFPTTWLVISAAVEAAAGYIWLVNELGGDNGVDINGVVGSMGVIVTPRVGKLYDDLIQAARAAIAARTILDFLVMASAKIPAVGAALNLPVVGGIFTAIESGTPLGWALDAAAGLVIDLAGQTPIRMLMDIYGLTGTPLKTGRVSFSDSSESVIPCPCFHGRDFFRRNKAAAATCMPIGHRWDSGKPGR